MIPEEVKETIRAKFRALANAAKMPHAWVPIGGLAYPTEEESEDGGRLCEGVPCDDGRNCACGASKHNAEIDIAIHELGRAINELLDDPNQCVAFVAPIGAAELRTRLLAKAAEFTAQLQSEASELAKRGDDDGWRDSCNMDFRTSGAVSMAIVFDEEFIKYL